MNKRVAIYCRVSTEKQGTGLEAQKRALVSHCNSQNILGYEIFSDEGVSGTKSSRPALNAMMDMAQRGEISTVLVYSFSRFARSTRHLLDSLEEFNRLGVNFISITENVDTNSAIGKALFTIISAISQLERELISERVRNGLVNARAKGKRLGRTRTRPGELIRALAAEGMSFREIARLAKCSHGAIAAELKQQRAEMNDGEVNRAVA